MSRVWFASDLETVATFWRVLRQDGVTLGFTSHDHDLWFDGVLHAASPGMVPSSIKRSADLEPDNADVEGALSHETITSVDLADGRFDGAQVRIGVVDWESGESRILYRGAIGSVVDEAGRFTAELISRKAELQRDPIPRTSPGCRAEFCGPGCALNPEFFTHEAVVSNFDPVTNGVTLFMEAEPEAFAGGWLRWLDGPHAGKRMDIMAVEQGQLILDTPLDTGIGPDSKVLVREGCAHTLDDCATRFDNVANFQGEPFLPGNDLLIRYPAPVQ